MYITRFAAKNYRNIALEEIYPCEGINVVYGGNAQGKTNLLEAIWMFTGGHSFRGAKDAEVIRFSRQGEKAGFAALELDFFSENREQSAVLRIENGRRTSWINEVKKNTGSALVGKVRAVIFSPEHLMLIKEGPHHRRKFMDTTLCQLAPSYAALSASYRRIIAQRNALLKEVAKNPRLADTVSVWDAQTANLGARVMEERKNFIQSLTPFVQEVFQGIAHGKEEIGLRYAPSFPCGQTLQETEQLFLQELSRTAATETRMGATMAGPHRDDLEILINGVSARAYGSQGQQRSAVLALKLAEAQVLGALSGEPPVVLLDDVLSELDKQRQDYLLNRLYGQQIFITSCEPDAVKIMQTGMRFNMKNGQVFPEEVFVLMETEETEEAEDTGDAKTAGAGPIPPPAG